MSVVKIFSLRLGFRISLDSLPAVRDVRIDGAHNAKLLELLEYVFTFVCM